MIRTEKRSLVGHTITAVYLRDEGEAIRFDLADAEPIVAVADGDCCSITWVESVDGIEQLIGATVVSVEDIDMPDLGDMDGREVVSYYGTKITTDKGFAVIDYRNDSNGYYGGDLLWPGENFYGHGDDALTVEGHEWKLLAGEESQP